MKEKIIKRKELNKGITLIALVITIIVLLILAGVTIVTLAGDNGLLSKANTAKNTQSDAEIEEKIKLAYEDYYLGQYTQTGYTFQNAVDKMFGTGVATVTESNRIYTVSFANGKKYTFNALTGVAGEKKPQELSTITSENYGDYFDLGQNVVNTAATSDDWRILYNDTTNGVVYVILSDYLPNNNASVIEAGLKTYYTYSVYFEESRADFISKLTSTTAWQGLIPEELRNSCVVQGATTGEIIMASYNEKYGTNLNYTSYPYFRTNPNDSSSSMDTLYIPHSASVSGTRGYWLNSPYDGSTDKMWAMSNQRMYSRCKC